MNSYYYLAKVFARQCVLDIRINDIPLIRETVDDEISFERPINYLIERTGKQMLSISVLPCQLSNTQFVNCEMNLEIWKYDASGHVLVSIDTVATIRFNGKDILANNTPIIKKSFIAEVGYEISRWSKCEVLYLKTDIKNMVVAYINKLTEVLSTKQFERYAQMIEQREHNICKSLYLGDDEVQKRMNMLTECLNGGFEYVPIKGPKKLQYFGNHRVVSVVGEDMKSAIQFYKCDTEEILTMDFLLGIPLGTNKLSII